MELRARNWPDKKDKATANGDATICEFRDLFSFPEAMMSNFVALIVEDDPFQRESLADLLKSEGLEVVGVPMQGSRNLCWLQPVLTSGLW